MFRKLLDKFNRFMYGRYGSDQTLVVILIIFLVLGVVNSFIGSFILQLAQNIILIFGIYRYFSKNIYKRREENRKVMAFVGKAKSYFLYIKDKLRDRKVCRYRKCKYCKAALRLPIEKGKHSVNCPRCKRSFDVHIWF